MASPQVHLAHFAASLAECPASHLPEVAFSGRSNVGKSSLINLLTRRKSIAHTSKNPGKTRVFTFYDVDGAWHLVDMPGYGYARVAPGERRRWQTAASQYFAGREQLVGVVQLIDLRVGVTPDDRRRLRQLVGLGHPLCLAMTKADKVRKDRREAAVAEHLAGLGLPPTTGVVLTSAVEKTGARELWAWMADQLPAGAA
jgi:GTP-binding protein